MQRRQRPIAALTLGIAFASLALVATGGEAQQRADAAAVAAQVESFYNQTRTFKARFHQTYYNKIYDRYQRSRGEMAVAKPGKVRFDYGGRNGKVISSNGETLTVWEPMGTGPGQYAEAPVQEASLPQAFSFLTGEGSLAEDYRFRLLNARAYRFDGHVLELRPHRADPRYRRILLFVDSARGRAGVVRRIRLDDHEGNRNKFSFRGMKFNRAIGGNHFAFRPPSGARRI